MRINPERIKKGIEQTVRSAVRHREAIHRIQERVRYCSPLANYSEGYSIKN